jgi:hypothetical protein
MLSVTGAVLERSAVTDSMKQMNLENAVGCSRSWDELVEIQIPQLTVWEKLFLDQKIHKKSPKELAAELNFKLHETISTEVLLIGYSTFQRYYPNFRHVLL